MPSKPRVKTLSAREVADKLGVDKKTVLEWVETGRLKGSITVKKETVTRRDASVLASSLKDPYKVVCLWCDKVFTAKHPRKAKFCCAQHRNASFYAAKRKPLRKK